MLNKNLKKKVLLDEFSRDYRLDLIKAISILLVLILHLRPIRIVVGEMPNNYIKIIDFILDQIYLNSTLIAVPLFILTSLFLFFQKLQLSGFKYLRKRCIRLLEIFIFWSVFHFFIYYSIKLFQSVRSSTPFSWYIPKLRLYKVIAGVDPPLPIVGDSVFYFIFVLILLTIVSYLLLYNKKDKFKSQINVGIITVSILYFEILNFTGRYIAFWRPDNFIIYIPLAYFLVSKGEKVYSKYTKKLYIFSLIFGLQDICLRAINKDVGLYARVSIVCGTLAVFSSLITLKSWQIKKSVQFLSKFSLGIFAVHKYWLLLSTVVTLKLFQTLDLHTSISIGGLQINLPALVASIITLLGTFISVSILDRSPLQRFIR